MQAFELQHHRSAGSSLLHHIEEIPNCDRQLSQLRPFGTAGQRTYGYSLKPSLEAMVALRGRRKKSTLKLTASCLWSKQQNSPLLLLADMS